MTQNWQKVPLAELLKKSDAWIELDPIEEYKEVTVRLWGKGVILRREVSGTEIVGKKRLRVKEGQFILSRIDARNGAFGLIPKELNGAVVSNDFPVFEVNQFRLLPTFLDWLSRTRDFVDFCLRASEGTTNRVRLKENKFLATEIMLPPFSEQQRIVVKINQLAVKVKEAQKLRQQNKQETDVLLRATARKIFSEVKEEITKVRDWLDPNREGIQTGPFGAQLGKSDFQDSGVPVLTIGNVQYNGLITDNLTYVSEEKAAQLQRYSIKEGDILFARMGTVGRCCVVPEKAEDWLINYHIIRLALDKSRIEPRFLHWTIQASKDIEDYLSETIRGATRAGVNSKIVGSLPCRVPPKSVQCRIVAYLDNLQAKVDTLKYFQTQTELDALLPSILDKAFKGEL